VSFTIQQLSVRDFRGYKDYVLPLDPNLTILVGQNAIGKTNLIEAIQLLTEGESFRRPSWAETVRWGSEKAILGLHAEDGSRRYDAELLITKAGRRTYKINNKSKRSSAGVAGTIPCVLFTPEDLRIVKDSAERRRAALDGIGVQLSPTYGRLKIDYDRVVRQRNALLKQEGVDETDLAPWDERLVVLGAKLTRHRRRLFTRIQAEASSVYAKLAAESLSARYVPSWDKDGLALSDETEEGALWIHMNQKKREEMVRGTTLVGPHRDDISFELDGKNARAFASQGQQRTISLTWKLSEVAVIRDVSGLRPILLLDDVMSELDESRRHALTRLVGESAQTVMTTTNLDYFDPELIANAQVVKLG